MKKSLRFALLLVAGFLSFAGASAQTKADDGETWKSIGTGTLRDDVVTVPYVLNNFWEFDVEMEESEQTPGRYRLVNAYKNCPKVGPEYPAEATNYLVIDASDPVHVYMEQGGTSYYIGQDQQLCVWSIADDYYNNLYGNWTKADEEGVCGTLKDGVITFPKGALLWVASDATEELVFNPGKHDYVWTTCNRNGMFRLKLPGTPDTDVRIDFNRYDNKAAQVHYNVSLSPDIDYCKAALFEGEYTPAMAAQIEDGSVTTVEVKTGGDFAVPYEKDGVYTLVLVPYSQGRAWEASYCTYEWAFSEAEWKKLGTAQYTEGIISSNQMSDYGLSYPTYTYDVNVEQNVANPALVRLVDPYGPEVYPEATNINYDTSKRYYLTFDFSDPDNVRLLRAEDTGLDLGYGRIGVWSYADRAVNDPAFTPAIQEALFPQGLPTGHYDKDTRTVSFDAQAFVVKFPKGRPDTWYAANRKGEAKLVLPEGFNLPDTGIEGVQAADNAPVRYYSIDGKLVNAAAKPAPGVYIMRKGGESKKVILK